MLHRRWIAGIFALALPLAMIPSAEAAPIRIEVGGQANIFGAGRTGDDATPSTDEKGGIPAPYFDLTTAGSGNVVVFDSVTGEVRYNKPNSKNPMGPFGPDGALLQGDLAGLVFDFSAYNGLSGFSTDRNGALYGVFINDSALPPAIGAPDAEPYPPGEWGNGYVAPAPLDFSAGGLGIDFTHLNPELNQIFFIGDGYTESGVQQRFYIPEGATRLYLGLADSVNPESLASPIILFPGFYDDNTGFFEANLRVVPEPSSVVLALTGLGATLALARRRSRTGSDANAA